MLACLADTFSISGAPNGIHARDFFAERRYSRTLEHLGALRDDRSVCEVCGTRYKSELQATYCTRTQLCRELNAPVYRHIWVPQSAILSLTNLAIDSALENLEGDTEEAAQRARDCLANAKKTQTETFEYVRDTWPVSGGVAHTAFLRMRDIMEKYWDYGQQIEIKAVCDLCVMLIDDLIFEFGEKWNREGMRAPKMWFAMRRRCLEIKRLWDGEYECPELNDLYDSLRDEIFPKNGSVRRPSLYVAGGRFLVIARGRSEVRECIRQQTGLVGLTIEGIGHGTRFDGIDEPEIIRRFPTVPQIIDTDFE